MTTANLPGQLELSTLINHKGPTTTKSSRAFDTPRDVQIAKLLRQYEERPTSETWSRIQALAAEILK